MTKPPLISVVVPTYQRREAVLRVLERLSAQTLPADQFEVLVVIDGSTDGTREAVGSLATPFALRSIWQENRGRSAARNTGLRAARGDFVAILDDDVEPVPGFLSAHLRAHADGRRLGVVGAVHFRLDDATPPFTRFEGLRFEDFIARLVKRGSLLDWSETYIGAFSSRRTAFLEVGGFEELFDGYGLEDFEIALRLSRAGLLFKLSTEAVAHHRHEKVVRTAEREHESRGRSAVILAKLHPPITAQDFGTRDLSPPLPPRRLVRYALPRMSRVLPIPALVVAAVGLAERVHFKRLDFADGVGCLCDVRAVQLAGQRSGGSGAGGGARAQAQLHRDGAHPARPAA
jgi:glycosyltransferase involved in cell wall biosynthesis